MRVHALDVSWWETSQETKQSETHRETMLERAYSLETKCFLKLKTSCLILRLWIDSLELLVLDQTIKVTWLSSTTKCLQTVQIVRIITWSVESTQGVPKAASMLEEFKSVSKQRLSLRDLCIKLNTCNLKHNNSSIEQAQSKFLTSKTSTKLCLTLVWLKTNLNNSRLRTCSPAQTYNTSQIKTVLNKFASEARKLHQAQVVTMLWPSLKE